MMWCGCWCALCTCLQGVWPAAIPTCRMFLPMMSVAGCSGQPSLLMRDTCWWQQTTHRYLAADSVVAAVGRCSSSRHAAAHQPPPPALMNASSEFVCEHNENLAVRLKTVLTHCCHPRVWCRLSCVSWLPCQVMRPCCRPLLRGRMCMQRPQGRCWARGRR